MKCRIAGCNNNAIAKCIWGTVKGQQGEFCQNHIDELWSKLKGSVGLGYLPFIMEEVLNDKT